MPRTGDWNKLKKIMKKVDKRLEGHSTVALKRAAVRLESIIRNRILDSKDMKPNHPFTVAMKRSSKPLIENADLLQSAGHRFIKGDTVFVGVNRRSQSGVNIAVLHEREKGTRINVTQKMRAFLHAKGLHLKGSTTVIFIPGRPYIKPSYRDFKERGIAKKLFRQAVKKTLKGE